MQRKTLAASTELCSAYSGGQIMFNDSSTKRPYNHEKHELLTVQTQTNDEEVQNSYKSSYKGVTKFNLA